MEGIGNGLSEMFGCMVIIIVILFCVILGLTFVCSGEDEIKTSKPIVPELQLIIVNNKVDTVYIYKEPKS